MVPTLPVQQKPPLPTALRRHVRAQRARKLYFRVLALPSNLGIGVFTLPWVLLGASGWVPKPFQWLILAGWVSSAFGCILAAHVLLRWWEASVRALVAADDTRLLGPLLESFQLPNAVRTAPQLDTAHAQARRGLLALLPRLTPDEAAQLTPGQWRVLHLLMTRSGISSNSPDAELSIALLRGLAEWGDSRDLPLMLKMAQERSELYSMEVAEIARQCADILQGRLTNRAAREALLRAVSSPTNEPEVLLRASGEADTSPAPELLRPHTPPVDETRSENRNEINLGRRTL